MLVQVYPSAASDKGPVRVGLFGDSLAAESEPYFNFLLQAGGKATVSDFAYGGTAACDWLHKMRDYARAEHPQAVVFEIRRQHIHLVHGRLSIRLGGRGTSVLLGRIDGDSRLSRAGTRVFLVGTPINLTQWTTHDSGWDALNLAFAALAAKHPRRVTYVDAGKSVEGPHQSFVWTLPCLVFEPCTGPTIAGVRTDVVRSPDGVHFCPDQEGNTVGQVTRCNMYSSGAFRFAAAMARPVIRELGLAGTQHE